MAQAEAVALESESSVLARAAGGDPEAFAVLVRRHQGLVFSVALHFFRDRALAEDLAQDVFVQLFQNLRSIESETHLVLWLRQVAARKCIDHGRSWWKRRKVSLEEVAERGSPAATADVLAEERLRRLVLALPEKFRAVVILRFQEDLTPAEMAAALGWHVNTVKTRLHRALKMLRKRL